MRSIPLIWLDVTYFKCRCGGRAASTAAVTAIGCDESGWRQVLGVSVVDTESHDSWLGFLQAPRDRGTSGNEFVRIRCPRGLVRAIGEVFQGGRPSSDARLHARGWLLAAEAPRGPASSLRSSAPGTPPPPWPCTTRRARCWWGAAWGRQGRSRRRSLTR